jgi:hypothetical protein
MLAASALVETFHRIQLQPYLEQMARTDPGVFFKWVNLLLGGSSGASNNQPRQQQVVNILGAIPRSPLDQLPPGFDLHR